MHLIPKHCENASALTFFLAPAAAGVAIALRKWQPTPRGFLLATLGWIAWQRFVSAGWRLPGKARLKEGCGFGKVAVVTGANTGIGYWTAVGLVESGATVIITCRDEAKGQAAVAAIKAEARRPEAHVVAVPMELTSLQSVRSAAAAIRALGLPLHILVNNAGAAVMPTNGRDPLTAEGHEATFAGNFVAPVLLTRELLPLLKSTGGRVINVGSRGHERVKRELASALLDAHPHLCSIPDVEGFKIFGLPGPVDRPFGYRAYCFSKLGNTMHAQWLAREHPDITAVSLHPGRVLTDVWRSVPALVDRGLTGRVLRAILSLHLRTAEEGAVTTLHCALAESVPSGAYFVDSRPIPASAAARDAALESKFMLAANTIIASL